MKLDWFGAAMVGVNCGMFLEDHRLWLNLFAALVMFTLTVVTWYFEYKLLKSRNSP